MSDALGKYNAALPATLEEVQAFGRLAKQAGLIPKEVNEFQAAAIVQAGREMGLAPLQSLRTISFVNGRLVMKVELLLALARKLAGVVVETLEEGADYCTVTLRRGEERVTTTFSDEDAKRAGLLNKGGAWAQYPRTMRRWRAIGEGLRLIAPDVTMGFLTPEEAESIALTFEPTAISEAVADAEQDVAVPPSLCTPEQRKRIHAAKRKLGLSDEEYRSFLAEYGVASSKDLTEQQAGELLSRFAAMWEEMQQSAQEPQPEPQTEPQPQPQADGKPVTAEDVSEQIKHECSRLGFSSVETIAIRSAIRSAGVDPERALRVLKEVNSRGDAIGGLLSIGVPNPFKHATVSAAAGA